MRFEVPQFIDVEDKIFGSLTLPQFIYLAGSAALAYIAYKLIPSPYCFVVIGPVLGLGGALAFYKLNNRTFIQVAQSFLSYAIKGKIYVWERTKPTQKAPVPVVIPKPPTESSKKFDDKTITDLAQNLDILDSYQK